MIERGARHRIGGEWLNTGTYHDGGAEAAQPPITAAVAAFRHGAWATDPILRTAALSHLAGAFAARLADVIDMLCPENGKLRYEAAFEANFIVRGLCFAADLALHNFAHVVDPRPGQQSMSIQQPVGSPGYLYTRALAPALAAAARRS